MVLLMKVNFIKVSGRVRVVSTGQMERSMTGSGFKIRNTEVEDGKVLVEIYI